VRYTVGNMLPHQVVEANACVLVSPDSGQCMLRSAQLRIPMKWGTDSDGSGAVSEQAALVTAMISEVPHLSQDFCE
jgi:hypothetical protein